MATTAAPRADVRPADNKKAGPIPRDYDKGTRTKGFRRAFGWLALANRPMYGYRG